MTQDDFSSDVGRTYNGDDLFGRLLISLITSSTVSTSNADNSVPVNVRDLVATETPLSTNFKVDRICFRISAILSTKYDENEFAISLQSTSCRSVAGALCNN